MKINWKERTIEGKNGFIIGWWQTITEIFTWKKFNWNIYQFILIEFENDIMTGAYEFTFVLLCCGIRIRIPHRTKKGDKFWKTTDSMMKKLNDSCYGWVNKKEYNDFKDKKRDWIRVTRIRELDKRKKIFIQ